MSVGPYLGNKAGVVARPFFLLVGTFVFFIDDDKSQILERTKTALRTPIRTRAFPFLIRSQTSARSEADNLEWATATALPNQDLKRFTI